MPIIEGLKRSDIQGSGPVPEGTYRFRVHGAEYLTPEDARRRNPNSQAQHDQIVLDLVIVDEGEHFGRHVFQQCVTTPGKNWLLGQFLDAIDYCDDDIDTDRFIDAEVCGVTIVQKGQGQYRDRNQVTRFLPVV